MKPHGGRADSAPQEKIEKGLNGMKTKNTLLLIFLLLTAIVLSALIGTLTEGIEYLKWLTWGDSVGFDTVNLDLAVINLSLSFKMQVNVLQVVFIASALLLYKKIR